MTTGGRNRKGFLLACSLSGADYKFQRLCHTFSLFRKCLVERCLRGFLSLVQCFLCGHSVNLYLLCRYLQGVLDRSLIHIFFLWPFSPGRDKIHFANLTRCPRKKAPPAFLKTEDASHLCIFLKLVVEQADSCKCHHHIVLVAGLNDQVIPDGSAGLGDVFDTALLRPLNVVAEGEEGVASNGHVLHLGQDVYKRQTQRCLSTTFLRIFNFFLIRNGERGI